MTHSFYLVLYISLVLLIYLIQKVTAPDAQTDEPAAKPMSRSSETTKKRILPDGTYATESALAEKRPSLTDVINHKDKKPPLRGKAK